jgi:hypothetical protein
MLMLSLPLIRRWVGPNRWYGLRTARTLADPKLWYDANAVAGERLAAAALTMLAGAIGFYFVPRWRVEHYATANLAVTTLALVYAISQIVFYARSWKVEPAKAIVPHEQEEEQMSEHEHEQEQDQDQERDQEGKSE